MPRPRTISDDEILAVARTTFLRDGAGASTRAIAKEAGISEAVLFQRFATKERLFFAAMVPGPAKLEEIFAAVPGQDQIQENIERILLRLLDYFREVMPVFLTLVSHPSFNLQGFLKAHDIPAMQIGGRLGEYLAAEGRLGRVRADDIPATTNLLINAIHNYAIMESLGAHDRAQSQIVVAGAVAAMWNGLAPD